MNRPHTRVVLLVSILVFVALACNIPRQTATPSIPTESVSETPLLLTITPQPTVTQTPLPPTPTVTRAVMGWTTIPDRELTRVAIPSDYIHIQNADDVASKRQKFVSLIWGDGDLPQQQAVVVRQAATISQFRPQLADVLRYDWNAPEQRTTGMDSYGFYSEFYYLHAKNAPRRTLVLYHTGHDDRFAPDSTNVAMLLNDGFDVMVFYMPLLGPNPRPTVMTTCCGPIVLVHHDQMNWLDHPLRFFIEPVIGAINYAQSLKSYDNYVMMGLSGGGWTTTLVAAIDPRIHGSFPVAGSLPEFLRLYHDIGDFEQQDLDLYQEVNYLELYTLGSTGDGRYQVQVLNELDPCCYSGRSYHRYAYEKVIRDRLAQLGPGEFSVQIDTGQKLHTISPAMMKLILERIKR